MGLREKGLSRYIVEHDSFHPTRQVGIDPILPEELVMLDMIPFESHRIRYTDGQISNDG